MINIKKANMMNFLSLAILVASCGQSVQGSAIEIPLKSNRGRPVIEVYVNNEGPFDFFLDTGAGSNVLDISVAKEASLIVKGETTLASPNGKGIAAVVYGEVTYSIGEVEFKSRKVSTSGMDRLSQSSGLDGVLSYRLFEDYLMTFDFKNRKLILEKKNLNSKGKNVVKYNSENSIIALHSKIGNLSLSMDMDTGSPDFISVPYELANQLSFESEPVEAGKIRLIDSEMTIYSAKLKDDVQIGSIKLESPNIKLTDFQGHGNIGMGFLMQYDVKIDQKNKLVELTSNGLQPRTSEPRIRTRTQSSPKLSTENLASVYAGEYEGNRKIWVQNDKLNYQRENAAILELNEKSKDQFALTFPGRNISLPTVRFERNGSDQIVGITFIKPNGQIEGTFQKTK
ncbi:MAG: aspartyl protease family protein [Cyclobacteriaceae bacterium]